MASAETYRFRRALPSDLPMIRRWLRVPEVARWWGDPAEQIELIFEDIELPEMATLIVSYRNRPFAFAQHYDAHQWPQPHLSHLPKGTRCIDAFIGAPDMMGCGHGKMFLRLLAQMLIDRGAPRSISICANNRRNIFPWPHPIMSGAPMNASMQRVPLGKWDKWGWGH